jgi:hypothetical protein
MADTQYKYLDESGLTHYSGILRGFFVHNISVYGVTGTLALSDNSIVATVSKADIDTQLAAAHYVIDASYVHTDNNLTAALKSAIESAIQSVSSDTSPVTATTTGTSVAISHDTSGVTAGAKGDTTAQTPTWGATFKVLSGTVDAYGHLTAFAEHTVAIPNSTATQSSDGLMSSADKTALDNLVATSGNSFGIVSVTDGVLTKNITADTTSDTIEISSGDAIVLTADPSADSLTIAHDTYGTAGTAGSTTNQTPAFGGTASVPYVTFNSTGHETAYGTASVTIPNSLANGASRGLVTLSDATDSTSAVASGVAATPKAVKDALDAAKAYADAAAAGALVYKGTVTSQADLTTSYKKGWYWVVGGTGATTIAGHTCYPGDMIIAHADYSGTVANDVDIIEGNLTMTPITNTEIDNVWASATAIV